MRNRDALLALYRARLGDDKPLVEFLSARSAKSVLDFDSGASRAARVRAWWRTDRAVPVITARVAGYTSAEAYYEDASCHNRVHLIGAWRVLHCLRST